jgi:small subunit ribosomal protein S10e
MSTYVPKKSRDDVYRYFFTEGVVVCEKNRLGHWTGELGGKKFRVPNIQVMQLMKSLKSRSLIKEQYAWRHFYWFLPDNGVEFLRKYLHLDASVVPNTQKKTKETEEYERDSRDRETSGRGRGRGRGFGRGRGGFGDDRKEYQRSGEEGRGRGRGRGFGRGRGRGAADEAAPEVAPAQE